MRICHSQSISIEIESDLIFWSPRALFDWTLSSQNDGRKTTLRKAIRGNQTLGSLIPVGIVGSL